MAFYFFLYLVTSDQKHVNYVIIISSQVCITRQKLSPFFPISEGEKKNLFLKVYTLNAQKDAIICR